MKITSKTALLILQPTPFCNINCAYCYLPGRSDKAVMPAEKMGELFRKVVTFPTIKDDVAVIWHAGEPLVMGAPYYATVFEGMRADCPEGLTISHCFQTNGTLITREWCDLFLAWNVDVGVSIDGPKEFHDAVRVTRRGGGTHTKAMQGITCLRDAGVPFHVISVLTRRSLADPRAMFEFYRDNDIRRIAFNIEEKEGVNQEHCFGDDVTSEEVIAFMREFFELMKREQFPIEVREFEQALAWIRFSDELAQSNEQVDPFGIITIDVHGNVYTFSPELAGYSFGDYPSFAVGNVFTDSFDDMANSATLRRMSDEIGRGVELCRQECEYFSVCGGGAPSNKIFENGSFATTETVFCRLTKKAVTKFVLDVIETAAGTSAERVRGEPAVAEHGP